jgi:hypothetical protein
MDYSWVEKLALSLCDAFFEPNEKGLEWTKIKRANDGARILTVRADDCLIATAVLKQPPLES